MTYDLQPIRAPRAAGGALCMLCRLAESRTLGPLVCSLLLGRAGVPRMRAAQAHDPPWTAAALRPDAVPPCAAARGCSQEDPRPTAADAKLPGATGLPDLPWRTAGDFAAAYRAGRTTPTAVAQRFVAALERADSARPPLRAFIAVEPDDLVRQAEQSTLRYGEGRPLSPLDGVPVAVKDEIDQAPYPTTVGTRFLGDAAAAADACVVERLRAAGALLVGKANMHEFGMGVTGLNPHHGSARNPYDPLHATGGSSSGPAAAVAAGLCPIAIGADGGGSVRTPASLCGVVGLKPTFGRVSERGAAPVCWSLAHIGPLAATVSDTALAYSIISGPDPHDPNTLQQPAPTLARLRNADLSGLRIGVYSPWFDAAQPEVAASCRAALDRLVRAGARIHEIEIPELALQQAVHLVTIVSEMAAAHDQYYRDHHADYGLDVRLNLALARRLTSRDYLHAQRLRTRTARYYYQALRDVDVIATPTCGCTAPLLRPDALVAGESDLTVTSVVMMYVQPANLTGLPAISVPAGYDGHGLPIGLMLMGRAWEEDLLLGVAAEAEKSLPRRRPSVLFDLLA